MNSILFPTNFSELSFNAFNFALDYAHKSKRKLLIFHAYDPNVDVNEKAEKLYSKVDIENFRNRKDKFPAFENLINDKKYKGVTVKYIVKQGDFISTLKEYVTKKEDKIELVILGTHGNKNNLFNIFMETNTLKVLEEINKPVIAIPEKAVFDGSLNNFAFLVDYQEEEKEALQQVIETTQNFRNALHVVHFDLAHGESIFPQMKPFKKSLELQKDKSIKFETIDTIDIKKAISVYCKNNKIDIVCLINHRRNFYQRMFSFSLAEELLNHLDIPVMAIYQE